MQLRLNITRSAPGVQPGDVVVLYAKVLNNDLTRDELTVEFISKTDQYAAVVGYRHTDPALLEAFYTPEED